MEDYFTTEEIVGALVFIFLAIVPPLIEEYTNRMQEIWGYDPYNVEPTESYCERAIHIE